MATHSSVLAWRIPGTGESRGLPSMGSHRVGHDWSDLAAAAALLLKGRQYQIHKDKKYNFLMYDRKPQNSVKQLSYNLKNFLNYLSFTD